MRFILIVLILSLTLSVKADIKNIPSHDLKKIKYFFKSLVDEHDFSYAIFGSKPMSLADFSLEIPSNLPFDRRIRSKFLMFKRKASLNAWYKYRDEFDFNNFIFLDEEKDLIDCLVLILINKKNMLRLLHEHESIFKEELGDSFIPESFLAMLEKREISLAKATHNSDKLLGIMLGYGVRNATIFQERQNLIKAIAKRKRENHLQEDGLSQKLQALEAQVGCFSELDANALIHPLYFLADLSHQETISLQKGYEQERQQIIELRKKADFMDVVFKRLLKN